MQGNRSSSLWWRASCAAFTMVLGFASTAMADPPVVNTASGPVQGFEEGGQRHFLGIPYAAPPVDDLRWRAPQPPQPWTDPIDATELETTCPQQPSPFGIASTDEDCLYLNVYAPDNNWFGVKRPVMVWLHPGAFVYGSGGGVDPEPLVERGVVVVTINYRLGPFGFLAHPALTAEDPEGTSGNYGLLDQQAALRWVRDNIGAFGGDANRVTIFGESAGGLSVHSHLVSPAADGLFDRAIVQSGAYTLEPPPLNAVEQHGLAYAAAVGCPNQDPACLRALPVGTLLAGPPQTPNGYLPNVDGVVLPATFLDAFASGNFNQVPVIEGSTADEWRLFVALQYDLMEQQVTTENYPQAIAETLGVPPEVVALIVQQYPLSDYPSPALALAAVGTDAVFACNARAARQLLSQHVPVYGYEFDDPNAPMGTLPPVSFPYGAYHGSEIQYLMDTTTPLPKPPLTSAQESLARDMQRYWTQFARYANPNTLGAPLWVRYFPILFDQIQLLTPPEPEPGYQQFPVEHKCDFWTALASGGE